VRTLIVEDQLTSRVLLRGRFGLINS
jgi:hypothetical protein